MRKVVIVLLVSAIWLSGLSKAVASGPVVTLLAKGSLPTIPAGDVIFRVVDLTQELGDEAVTHQHLPSMVYVVSGPHLLTIDTAPISLQPGQATWIDDQVVHTHASDGHTASHFIAISLPPADQKGQLRFSTAFHHAKVTFESTVIQFADRHKQDVILTDYVYGAGEDSGTLRYAGPTLFSVQAGKFTVVLGGTSLTLQPGDYLAVQAGAPIEIQADMSAGGHILVLSVIPSGQPVLLPTG